MKRRRVAVLPEGLKEIVGEVIVLGVVLHLVGLRLLSVASGREAEHRVGVDGVGHAQLRRKGVIGNRRRIAVAEQQVPVLTVGVYGLHGMRRNRIVDRAVEPDERVRRTAARRRRRNEVRRERLRVVAELALPRQEPEVLSVVRRVGEVVFVLFLAQAEVDVELVGRIPLVLERECREIRLDGVDEPRVAGVGHLPVRAPNGRTGLRIHKASARERAVTRSGLSLRIVLAFISCRCNRRSTAFRWSGSSRRSTGSC